jgi:simple sugar transport system permease protein
LIQVLNFKLERREHPGWWSQVLSVALALSGALLLSALLIRTAGADLGLALGSLFRGAFGSRNALLETLVQATPLIFTGLAVMVAFRGRIWNIGAEGQFFAGAIAATWVSLNLAHLPRPLFLTLIILTAGLGGAFWGWIPGILKTRFGASEIIVTVMMNYIIQYLLSFLLSTVWRQSGDFFLQSARFSEATYFPTILDSRLHLGFFVALATAVLTYILLWRTPLGYEIRAIGENPRASRYKGIPINRVIVLVMLISGAIAGLAGGSELAGLHHRLRLDISTGYGFTGILIALLGRLHPVGVILAAIFFGALVNGSTSMQIFTGVPVALVYSIQGIVLIFLLTTEVVTRYRIRRVADAG